LLVLAVFAINVYFQEPVVESLLFAVALAVGMTPELLPAIISITLSAGARTMATHGVIVRRLASIENFGSMDVLCTDKTGTLTEGVSQPRARGDLGSRHALNEAPRFCVGVFATAGAGADQVAQNAAAAQLALEALFYPVLIKFKQPVKWMMKKDGSQRVESPSRLIDARIEELGDWRGGQGP
jgi:hypothetical protein